MQLTDAMMTIITLSLGTCALQVKFVVVSSQEICHVLFRNLTTAMYDPMESISISNSEESTTAGLTVKPKHSWLIPKVVHSVKHNMGSETRGKPIRQNLY